MTDQPEREAPTAEVELVSPFEFNKLLEEHVERRVRASVLAETDRCERAINTVFRNEETRIQESERLHGISIERKGQAIFTPRIREAADLGACRLMAVSAIRALLGGEEPSDDRP